MAAGRPTLYKDEYCDLILDLTENYGLSVYELAMRLKVNVDTLYEWEKHHPEFSEAFTRARDNSLAWSFKVGRQNLESRNFNSRTHELIHNNLITAAGNRRIKKRIKGMDHIDKCNEIFDAMLEGSVTEARAQSLMNMLLTKLKSSEQSEVKKEIIAIKLLQDKKKGNNK